MKSIFTFIIVSLSISVFACKTTSLNGSQRFINGAIQKIDSKKYSSYSIKHVKKNLQSIIIELSGSGNDCVELKYTVKGLPNCDVVATLHSSKKCQK